MEKLGIYFKEAARAENIGTFISFVIAPETGEEELVDRFYQDISSIHPAIVAQTIETIENKNLPLHHAANGLRQFISRKEFNEKKPYELTLFHSIPYEYPADSHIDFPQFFDTTTPFNETSHYLALTRKGLSRILNKAQQPQYKVSRSYQKESIEGCFIAASELVANSLERPHDPIPDEFLQECSFGPLFLNFIELLGTDSSKAYERSKHGIDLLYDHGSWRDQQAIDQVRNKLEK